MWIQKHNYADKRKCKNTQEWGVCGVVMNFVKYIFSEIGKYITYMYCVFFYYYGIRPVSKNFLCSSYYDVYSYFFIMLLYPHQSFLTARNDSLVKSLIYMKNEKPYSKV